MAAPAPHATTSASAFASIDAYSDFSAQAFFPGERLSPLPGRVGRRFVRWIAVMALLTLGGVGIIYSELMTLTEWLPAEYTGAPTPLAPVAPGKQEPVGSDLSKPPTTVVAETPAQHAMDAPPAGTLPPIDEKTATAPAEAPPAVSPITTAALTAPTRPAVEPRPDVGHVQPAEPSSPNRRRATAVGLDPDLSPVRLGQLSATDYRNAGAAIKTALAETPDTAVYTWPKQRQADLALFKVRFVPGAAPGCRRYVVTVSKSGWATTAQPMQKCGAEASGPRRR